MGNEFDTIIRKEGGQLGKRLKFVCENDWQLSPDSFWFCVKRGLFRQFIGGLTISVNVLGPREIFLRAEAELTPKI